MNDLKDICFNGNKMENVNISINPQSALVDEKVAIVVKGLSANHSLTIVALMNDDRNFRFASYAWYTSDDKGWLDLSTMAARGGRYEGVEPMGLFCTLQPSPSQPKGTRLMKRDVTRPYTVHMHVVSGHREFTGDENFAGTVSLAQCHCERWYLAEGVQRVPVDEGAGNLKGTLFIPPGPGPHPAVLDLFGSVGGIVEYRAALLASRGFVTFALQYFTPGEGDGVRSDLEYFVSAVDYLLARPGVCAVAGAGVVSVSLGSDMALLLAAVCPRVTAMVGVSGLWYPSVFDCTYKNETFVFPHLQSGDPEFGNIGGLKRAEDGEEINTRLPRSQAMVDFYRPFISPVERSQAHFLFLHGDDDSAGTCIGGRVIKDHLASFGRSIQVQAIIYPGAGHLIEPPYSPHCRRSYNNLYRGLMVWGGNARDHSRAQEDAWARILRFFREHLSGQQNAKL